MTSLSNKNKSIVMAVAAVAIVSSAVVVFMSMNGGTPNTVPWWKSTLFHIMYASKDAELMEKLERISIAADFCENAANEYEKELQGNQSVHALTLKKLQEASIDVDYLFSVLDKADFSSGTVDVKNKRKEIVNKCNKIAKRIDHLLSSVRKIEEPDT